MTIQTNTDGALRRQTQPGAARPVEPGMSRRAMLTGVGAALAGAATVGATFPALAASAHDVLGDLIKAHREAHAVYYAAIDAEEAAEAAFRSMTEGRELWCAVSIGPNGETLSGFSDMARLDEADVVARIKDTHNSLRATHHSKWSQIMVLEFADQMMEAISAAEARALANIDVVKARHDQLREVSGLAQAAQTLNDTMELEQMALARLLVYRPRTNVEREAKVGYLDGFKKLSGDWRHDYGTMAFLHDLLNEV